MVTEEELEQIVSVVIERIKPFIVECMNKASETALLALPEVQRQQILMQESKRKMVTEFYENHKDLQTHKPIVSTVIEQVMSDNPGLEYKAMLEKAEPIIRERVKMAGQLSMTKPEKPTDLSFKSNPGVL